MTRAGLARIAAIVILVTAAAPVTPAAAAAPSGCPTGKPKIQAVPSASVSPVIVVHGWTSNPSSMAAVKQAVDSKLKGRAVTYSFDYAKAAENWAGDPVIADCLAELIAAVSASSKSKGGDGKVYLAGHSLGGLAVRYAAGLTVNGVKIVDVIGGLITFDTPHRGSVWGGTAMARVLVEVEDKFGAKFSLPDALTDAAHCLRQHHGGDSFPTECGTAPPYLNAPVHEIAGGVSVKRNIMGYTAYTIALGGDSIVEQTSQKGYPGSGPTADTPYSAKLSHTDVTCELTTADILRYASSYGLAATQLALAATALDGYAIDSILGGRASTSTGALIILANLIADCSHVKITKNRTALDAAVTTLSEWLPPPCVTRAEVTRDGKRLLREAGIDTAKVNTFARVEASGSVIICQSSWATVSRVRAVGKTGNDPYVDYMNYTEGPLLLRYLNGRWTGASMQLWSFDCGAGPCEPVTPTHVATCRQAPEAFRRLLGC